MSISARHICEKEKTKEKAEAFLYLPGGFLTSVSVARRQRGVKEGLALRLLGWVLSLSLALGSCLRSLLGLRLHTSCWEAGGGSWRRGVISAKLCCLTLKNKNKQTDRTNGWEVRKMFFSGATKSTRTQKTVRWRNPFANLTTLFPDLLF